MTAIIIPLCMQGYLSANKSLTSKLSYENNHDVCSLRSSVTELQPR